MSNVVTLNIREKETQVVKAVVNNNTLISIIDVDILPFGYNHSDQSYSQDQGHFSGFEMDSVIGAIESQNIIYNVIELPFKDHKKIEQVAGLQIQDNLPFDLESFQSDFVVAGELENKKYKILSSIVPKNEIANCISLCTSIGADPKLITTGSSALFALALYCHPQQSELIAYLEVSQQRISLAILYQKEPLHLRDFYPKTDIAQGIPKEIYQHILCSIYKAQTETNSNQPLVYVVGNYQAFALSNYSKLPCKQLDLSNHVVNQGDKEIKLEDIVLSLGLIVNDLKKDKKSERKVLNFRQGNFAYKKIFQEIITSAQEYTLYFSLAIILSFCAYFLKLYLSFSSLSKIDHQISSIVQQTLPDEKVIYKNELPTLQSKITDLEEELRSLGSLSSTSTLDAFKEIISSITPDMDVSIESLRFGTSHVLMKGTVAKPPLVGTLNRIFESKSTKFCKVNFDPKGEVAGRYGFSAEIQLCE